MKKTLSILSLVTATAFAVPAHAQIIPNVTPFSFEVRGGLAFPSGDFGDGIGSGTTLGANATFHFVPLLGIYGGYTRNEFEGDDDSSVTDEGFSAGLRVAIPTPLIPIDPYVKGGAVFNTLEGVAGSKTDRSLGFEVGAGVGIGLGPKLSFTPQVTYTKYTAETESIGTEEDVEHIRVDVGLRIRL